MRNAQWHTWDAAFDAEWKDEVDPTSAEGPASDTLRRDDFDDLVADAKDMARTIVECTIEPLRAFARTLPDALAFEHRHWRHARRRWARSRHWNW